MAYIHADLPHDLGHHGCFKVYLYEIGRTDLPICAYRRGAVDTAVHMLLFYLSWANRRVTLFDALDLNVPDRTYGAVIGAALNSSRSWTALANF